MEADPSSTHAIAHTSSIHDLDDLVRRLRNLSSGEAYWLWRKATREADAECAEVDAADREVAELQKRLDEAKQAETRRQRHEQALSTQVRLWALTQLQKRLDEARQHAESAQQHLEQALEDGAAAVPDEPLSRRRQLRGRHETRRGLGVLASDQSEQAACPKGV